MRVGVTAIKVTRSLQGGGFPRLFSLWGKLWLPSVQTQEIEVYFRRDREPQS